MADSKVTGNRIVLGDSVPWFSAPLLTGGLFDLHVSAGRWVMLSFLGPSADPRTSEELNKLLQNAALFREDHMVCAVVLADRPSDVTALSEISSPSLFFLADDDGAIRRAFGAATMPRTVVLDPMLRAVADIAWDFPNGHAETVASVLRGLPTVDEQAGVPMTAPALIVPRVFSFELCDFLMQFYAEQSAAESGFQLDVDGKTKTILDGRFKRRSDVPVAAAEVRDLVRDHVVRRLVPQIERYFQFQATRMDRYVVACYDAAVGGHFFRHRDNVNAGAQHRRFALSINLNKDFDGGDIMFPEFGRRLYRPPVGGAVVFSCAALHQVVPVTRGRRFAFLAFLYGEEDVKTRLANNARLHEGETHYLGERDRLFPAEAPPLAANVAA
ncbi:MAG TPA: 2OG-Fe(II) oxygenase [Xanthobacteraceae bacterium]|nr:2OG-Fe(II) oxygenase [Xanthobacteraceae bacterium]